MPTIVQQLQLDAANPKISVSTLLQRVKIVAAKLKLEGVASWVDREMNGYTEDVPEYRKMHGALKAFNPYNGWIPIHGDDRWMSVFSAVNCCQSVSELEHVLAKSEGYVTAPLSHKQSSIIDEMAEIPFGRYAVHFGESAILSIINKVRNSILDWALELEGAGIVGTEFSFSQPEKDRAKEASMTVNIGTLGAFTGNLGSNNVSGAITASKISVGGLTELVSKVQPHIDAIAQETIDSAHTRGLFDDIALEIRKTKPQQGTLKGLVVDFRNALAGAAGSLLASGVLAQLDKICAAAGITF